MGRAAEPSERFESPSERDLFLIEARELLAVVRRRIRWIAAAAAISTAGALALVATHRPVYTSTAEIMLDPRGLNVVDDQIVPAPASSDVNDAVVETETRLITSDSVLLAAVASTGLARDPEYGPRPGLGAILLAELGLKSLPQPGREGDDVAAAELRRQITVARDGKSFIVAITVRAGAPAKAARLAGAVAHAFLDDLVRQRHDTVERAQGAMGSTLKGQRDRLNAAETAVERYKAAAGILDADGRTLNTGRITELDTQLLAAHAATGTLAARLAEIDRLRQAPSGSDTVESQLLTQLRASRAEAVRQQANLRATLGPRHPQVQEIDAQVQSLDRAVTRETDRLYAATRADYQAAAARETSLARDRDALAARVTGTNGSLVELRELEREAEAQRAVYAKYMGRSRELKEQEPISAVNATLIAEPEAPTAPVGLKPSLLVVAGAVLGLLVGTAAAWLFERFSGRIHSAARLGADGSVPILGSLPVGRLATPAKGTMLSMLDGGRGSASSRALLRLADALNRPGGPTMVGLLVAALSDGPAGAAVAANLALAEAALGHGTLLIDATGDPATTMFGVTDPRPGNATSCWIDGFPPVAHLWVRRGMAAAALAACFDGYERIVMAVGPATDAAAFRSLVASATALVLVAEAGMSRFADLDEVRELIAHDAGKLLGALVVEPGADRIVALPVRTASREAASQQAASVRPVPRQSASGQAVPMAPSPRRVSA